MSEKILNEFAVRLNKSRTQLVEVSNQVNTLKQEAAKYQKQLEEALEEKGKAEKLQDDLKEKFIATKLAND